MISLSLTHLILITVQFMEFSQIISLKFIFNNSTFAIFCRLGWTKWNPTHLLGYGSTTLWLTPPFRDTWTCLNPTYESRLFSIWRRYCNNEIM